MINPRRFIGSHIKHKLALLSVVPVALVAILLTWHTIESSREQIRTAQLSIASQLARNLATLSDFALYSGREDLLQPLVDSASEMPGIANILFLDPDRNTVLDHSLPRSIDESAIRRKDYRGVAGRYLVVEKPVYLMNPDVSDYADSERPEKTLIGHVVVIADNTYASRYTQQTVITHLLISLAILLGAILLSFVLSNHVVSPITSITRTVRELERGNLEARIIPTTGDELAILANGINHLAKTVAEARTNLESKVDMATERLRKTLDDLQSKNQELEAARSEAESASAAKGEFLAHMSHELRTPITAIQGFVNLLTASELQPAQARYCNIIQQASNQLLQLIDDILDITRLQSDAIALDNVPFRLAECVETPLSLMAPNAHEKGLELILDVSPGVPQQLYGDSLRIRQVVYNLISNAIKFTPSGYVGLAVSARQAGEKQITLVIQVTDTGIGIPDKDQAKLFEAFSQADNSISRRFGGSGLGLSIVKRIVALMEGALHLESTAGRGSSFTIEIPLETTATDRPQPPAGIGSVLVYDAFPESRQALEHRLSRYVDTIVSCEDFVDLEISDSGLTPDLIIYSAPLSQSPFQLEQEVTRLRSLYDCPITVLTPATSVYRQLGSEMAERLRPISFVDRPLLTPELERLCSNPGYPATRETGEAAGYLNASILITEDNEFTRILLATFFENSQCHIELAADGREAIDQCNGQKFDLILMDVHMPEVNGLTALQTIRAGAGPNAGTPVIMLTADILQQEEDALFRAGASDLLFKPIDQQKLLNCVYKHLKTGLREDSLAGIGEDRQDRQRRLFLEEVSRLTARARRELSEHTRDGLRETTHQLLGIAGVYRMTYLERAVRAFHKAIKSGDEEKMTAAMETLELEVENLRRSMDDPPQPRPL